MYVLGQMLTPDSRAQVLGEATTFGDEWLEHKANGRRGHEIALLPIGSQAVPTTEPDWDYNVPKRRWDKNQLLDVFLKDSSKCPLRL